MCVIFSFILHVIHFQATFRPALRVSPGVSNQGIFVSLTSGPGEGEKYQITHPVAIVTGILRGNPYATITESVRLIAYIECSRIAWSLAWLILIR